jgi:hypothetical protein
MRATVALIDIGLIHGADQNCIEMEILALRPGWL